MPFPVFPELQGALLPWILPHGGGAWNLRLTNFSCTCLDSLKHIHCAAVTTVCTLSGAYRLSLVFCYTIISAECASFITASEMGHISAIPQACLHIH